MKDPNVFKTESFQAVNRNSMPEGVLRAAVQPQSRPALVSERWRPGPLAPVELDERLPLH